jgi:hypothetical protein
MRATKTRFSTIGGALLAIGVVLAVAIHLSEQIRGLSPSQPVLTGGLSQETSAAGLLPSAAIVDRSDDTDQGRRRVLVHALLSQPITASSAEHQLTQLADALYREDSSICIIAVLAYASESERTTAGDDAPWTLVWSPDGRGWDGLSQNDSEKHFSAR